MSDSGRTLGENTICQYCGWKHYDTDYYKCRKLVYDGLVAYKQVLSDIKKVIDDSGVLGRRYAYTEYGLPEVVHNILIDRQQDNDEWKKIVADTEKIIEDRGVTEINCNATLSTRVDHIIVEQRNAQYWRAKYDMLRDAVKEHHSPVGDDRCIEDDNKLYAKAGLPPADVRIGDPFEMIGNCWKFIKNRCIAGGPWISYRGLLEEVGKLRTSRLELLGENEKLKTFVEKVAMVTVLSTLNLSDLCLELSHEAKLLVMNRQGLAVETDKPSADK